MKAHWKKILSENNFAGIFFFFFFFFFCQKELCWRKKGSSCSSRKQNQEEKFIGKFLMAHCFQRIDMSLFQWNTGEGPHKSMMFQHQLGLSTYLNFKSIFEQ